MVDISTISTRKNQTIGKSLNMSRRKKVKSVDTTKENSESNREDWEIVIGKKQG